ncbi:MAG: hypothetical protein P9X26_07775 [Candidatus Stygibacter frigidus]|nr:hypothetical protein [Candidatus Stygibacter frigidus]
MRYVIFIFFIFSSMLLLSSESDSLFTQDQISDMTIMFYQQVNDTLAIRGSGTLLNYESRYFILTASHVANKMTKTAKVLFRLPEDKPEIVDLLTVVGKNDLDWKNHKIADISMIEVYPKDERITNYFCENSFPLNQINFYKTLVSREADLTFLGYPVIDLTGEHFSPLIFTGYLASGLITQLRYDTQTKCNFFFLNIPSIQGCSGSGVFFSVKKKMYIGNKVTNLIGIVHGTKSDNTGGKLAAITPSYYVKDLLNEF